MTSLIRRCSLEESLASQIRTFITRYLKFDVGSIGGGSHLSDDLGLDLQRVPAGVNRDSQNAPKERV
jgi:hypothetical protein